MKKKIISIVAFIAIIPFGYSCNAYASATPLNVSATIEAALTVELLRDMSFGPIVPSNQPGYVEVGPDNSVSTSNVTLTNQALANPGSMRVTGTPSAAISIILPPSVTLYESVGGGPGGSMQVSDIIISNNNNTPTIPPAGFLDFAIGGKLNLT